MNPRTLWREANRGFYASRAWASVTDPEGRRILKYPTDLYVFEEVIRRCRPEVIVETGAFEGGSAGWFARFADVISVDVNITGPGTDRITWVVGDSVRAIDHVTQLVAGRRCMVTLDSDHSCPHVLAELEVYAPLATEYLIVEDTAVDVYGIDIDRYPDGGPGAAVRIWLDEHPEWEPDTDCDRFLLGMNPGGWLRRR